MIKNIIFVILGLLVFSTFTSVSAMASSDETMESGTNWLALVDQGKYGESWEEASSLFKRAITREQWMKAVQDARDMLGGVVQRELSSSEEHNSLPGVPDGKYIILFFKTEFEKKKEAMETLTLMLDSDQQWRVAGYYVK